MARNILILALLATPIITAQTTLTPVLDASDPGNPDNGTILVIQPSRHGPVYLLPQLTGDTGYQALPILSLQGRYEMTNSGLFDTFCSIDSLLHLIFPNPAGIEIPAWLAMVGPLQSGALTPFTPPTLVSGPVNEDIAVYFQIAQVMGFGGGALDFDFSNGLTIVQTEGLGNQLTGAPAIASAKLGAAMAVGDFNGDGVDDLAVGAPEDMANGLLGAGRVYVFVGLERAGGFLGGLHPTPFIIEEPDFSQVFVGENTGPEHHAHFGAALAAGDLDGDGIDELVIGAPEGEAVSGEPNPGEAYVYLALETLLTTVPPIATPTLIAPPLTDIIRIRPDVERAEAHFGFAIAVGDVDGDTIDDVVVSAPFLDVSLIAEQQAGAAYTFYGPFIQIPGPTRDSQLTIQDDTLGTDERFGAAIALADIDGDGRDELLCGVPGQMVAGTLNAGKITIHSIEAATAILDDTVEHPAPIALADLGSSISVGDINGDGVLDIVAGANEAVNVGGPQGGGGMAPNAGIVYVIRGPSYAAHEILTTPTSPQPYERFGSQVLVADLNCDGIDDIVSGAPGCAADGNPLAGRAFVYFGSTLPSLDDDFRILSLKSDSPQPLSLFGMAMTAGDFAGVGVNDLICAEPLAGVATGGAGRVVVYTDLLHRKDNLSLPDLLNGIAPNQ
ncbi:MAG: hypothetical protein CMJ83_19740 [Planctomycetes bacterium]|nr:hypothetical protein [Planctomycetota bacterium]